LVSLFGKTEINYGMDRFIFWGLFLILGLIVLGYTIWMYLIEHKENNQEK